MRADYPSPSPRRGLALRIGALASLVITLATVPRESSAQTMPVPSTLQAELLAKVAGYDRNFAARAGDRAKILLLVAPGDPESSRAAQEMKRALSSIPTIGTLSHDEEIATYSDAAALSALCTAHRIAIVYLGPGFSPQIAPIRGALSTLDVLSVGGIADYVPAGIVLGFDLVSGNPKLLINLGQARAQHVSLRPDALKLMKVFE